MSTPDIDILAATAYSTGIDPITYATDHVIKAHVDTFLTVRDAAVELGIPVMPDTGRLSRRMLGDLMAAGWKAPEVTP